MGGPRLVSNDPVPTTYTSHVPDAFVQPHAETHELEGTDPVLGQLRLLGSATLATQISVAGTTYTDSGLTVTVVTRGGELEIEISGARTVVDTATTAALFSRAVIDSTNLTAYIESCTSVGADNTATSLQVASTLRWYTTPTQGTHTIKVQFHGGSATGTGYYAPADAPVRLNIIERIPIRRA